MPGMMPGMMPGVELPLAVCGYLAIALIWPTWSTWRRSGVWPVVFHREAAPLQRAAGLIFAVVLLGLVGWSLRIGLGDPAEQGVVAVPVAICGTGWLLVAAGTVITRSAQVTMGRSWRIGIDDRPTELVTHGPFRWSRNPIFAGMTLTLGGFLLVAPSLASLCLVAVLVASIQVQVRFEELHLLARQGDAYRRYAARVGRFVPWWGRIGSSPRPTSEADSSRTPEVVK
ncbi:MAG: isoprenylcysteine carboxylmethyltransferase family protein [Deltaproteobacteria bacterium]|nr:isoprenylcysteine carboxylmethyltransferase family protein [Deltaproteobacteria bacterium]